jgi:hypothetical protein
MAAGLTLTTGSGSATVQLMSRNRAPSFTKDDLITGVFIGVLMFLLLAALGL